MSRLQLAGGCLGQGEGGFGPDQASGEGVLDYNLSCGGLGVEAGHACQPSGHVSTPPTCPQESDHSPEMGRWGAPRGPPHPRAAR